MAKYEGINFTPPKDVQAAARRGLQLHEDGKTGAGLEPITVSWARRIANGENISPEKAWQGNRWWGRNKRFLDFPKDSPAYAAAMLWFGQPGKRWMAKLVNQMEAADMQNKSLATLAQQILTVRGRMENEAQNGEYDAPDGPIIERIEVRPNPEARAVIEAALIQKDSARPLPLTYKSGGHAGAMVALFLPTSFGTNFALNDSNALPPSDMHITLAYLGKADQLTEWQKEHAHEIVKLIAENHPPLQGNINGCGRFCNDDDGGDPFFIIPDLPKLPNLRQIVVDFIDSRCEIEPANNHGYTPHITLTYIPHSDPNPFDQVELTPVTFPTISLVMGNDRYDYPFTMGLENISKAALIEKIGIKTEKVKLEIEATQVVLERFKRFLAMLSYNTSIGHSANFGMFADGDGADYLKVSNLDLSKYRKELKDFQAKYNSIEMAGEDGYYSLKLESRANPTKAALVQKIGARHTSAECATIQKIHDLTLDLGAECHPLTRRAGARHSHADQGMVQRLHDDCARLGAECKALPERDRVYGSQVLKDGEIIKGSAGSGNYGHDGRPGKKGGSQRGGGLRRIGAKKDSKPGARKRAAKKFREKRQAKAKGAGRKTSEIIKNPKSLSGGAQVALIEAGEKGARKFGIIARSGDKDALRELADSGLGTFSKSGIGDSDLFKINNDGLKARENLTKKPAAKKAAKKKSPAKKKDLSKMSQSELNIGFLNAKNHKERVDFAEGLLKGFSDKTIARSSKEIPKIKTAAPAAGTIATKGKNAIFKTPKGAIEFGKVLQDSDGVFYNANFNNRQAVTPIFKAALTLRSQSDAPNYAPASTPQRCENCKFFLGDPGRDWCELFDFTADPDYHCDDWEAQRPDEIPGYTANKADLAALTEGILTLRGGAKLT